MKVSQPSAELINLCLNEATHLVPCALTAHPSHVHSQITKLEFWVTDIREHLQQPWVPKVFLSMHNGHSTFHLHINSNILP